MPTIRVDNDVWREMQIRAEAFKDSPNDVLRRVLGLDARQNDTTLFDLVVMMLKSRGKKKEATITEIRRRCVAYGWIK